MNKINAIFFCAQIIHFRQDIQIILNKEWKNKLINRCKIHMWHILIALYTLYNRKIKKSIRREYSLKNKQK